MKSIWIYEKWEAVSAQISWDKNNPVLYDMMNHILSSFSAQQCLLLQINTHIHTMTSTAAGKQKKKHIKYNDDKNYFIQTALLIYSFS